MGDTFDKFQPPERGRFGDNEIRGNDSVRSSLVDVTVTFVTATEKAIGVVAEGTKVGPTIYLAKSLIEYEPREPRNGQTIEVTMPRWLAKREGLA